MRIGIDTHAAEQDGSGNCTYIRNLVEQLIKIDRKNEYVLFVTDPQHSFYAGLPKKQNLQIQPIRRKPSWFRVFVSLPAAASRSKVDLLHVQYFAPVSFHGKLVVTVHDLIPFIHPEHFSLYERLLFRVFLTGSIKRASRILTVSDTSKKDLVELLHINPEKVTVTYDGVDPRIQHRTSQYLDSDTLIRYGTGQDYFLSVGRIDARKNLGRLIDGFVHAKKLFHFPHKLLIAGKFYYQGDKIADKIRSSEFANDILLTGYVPDDDLSVLYRNATAFLLVSEYEGFGLPALEAMVCGTPVIASNLPVFDEILKDCCLFVNPLDHLEIAEAMQDLVSNPELRESLSQKGRQRAQIFTWESTALLTLEAYLNALR